MYGGGGDVVAHSSVLACHGSSPAMRRFCRERRTLMKKTTIETAIRYEPMVEMRFNVPQPRSAVYSAIRRGMPRMPRMCMGKKVRLNPISISQKWSRPSPSRSRKPVIFGNQK